jgi:hypothetical protein
LRIEASSPTAANATATLRMYRPHHVTEQPASPVLNARGEPSINNALTNGSRISKTLRGCRNPQPVIYPPLIGNQPEQFDI